jgi:hypothetical protein
LPTGAAESRSSKIRIRLAATGGEENMSCRLSRRRENQEGKTSHGADHNTKRESKTAAQPGALIQKLITRRQIMAGAKDENWAREVLERKIDLQTDRH